jgi:hypothetical protein
MIFQKFLDRNLGKSKVLLANKYKNYGTNNDIGSQKKGIKQGKKGRLSLLRCSTQTVKTIGRQFGSSLFSSGSRSKEHKRNKKIRPGLKLNPNPHNW